MAGALVGESVIRAFKIGSHCGGASRFRPWMTATGSSELVGDEDGVQRIRFTSPAAGAEKKLLRMRVNAP
jgi:hypothetical protein